jgi:LmbE family N-acetylglucosaminyl deacetylase
MNPYQRFVSEYARLIADAKNLPLGGFSPAQRQAPPPDAPRALIFSPHPDDECVVGALALRLLREANMNVTNVPVTLGSNTARRAERFEELKRACDHIGFGVLPARPAGLEKINLQTREADPAHWQDGVQTIAKMLALHQPQVIFFPHEADWNSTHVGTHFLLMDALKCQSTKFQSFVVETEFWGATTLPNLMVESSVDDVATLVAALSFHASEVRRNPFHLRLPAWMQDNVRRGSELVGGQGSAAPDFGFAMLYRLRRWRNGGIEDVFTGGRQLSIRDNAAILFT